jgi:hypothetical protein
MDQLALAVGEVRATEGGLFEGPFEGLFHGDPDQEGGR